MRTLEGLLRAVPRCIVLHTMLGRSPVSFQSSVGAASRLDAYVLDAPVLLALGRPLRGLLIIQVPRTSISSFLPRLRRLQM